MRLKQEAIFLFLSNYNKVSERKYNKYISKLVQAMSIEDKQAEMHAKRTYSYTYSFSF